jgi:hypothetical protein
MQFSYMSSPCPHLHVALHRSGNYRHLPLPGRFRKKEPGMPKEKGLRQLCPGPAMCARYSGRICNMLNDKHQHCLPKKRIAPAGANGGKAPRPESRRTEP